MAQDHAAIATRAVAPSSSLIAEDDANRGCSIFSAFAASAAAHIFTGQVSRQFVRDIEQQGYTTTLMQPNRRDFIVTATLMVDAITRRQTAVVEVRFFGHDRATTVELRNGMYGGPVMGREAWPFVEQCARIRKEPS